MKKYITIFVLLLMSCKDCPSGKKIGEANLSNKTLEFSPYSYSGNESLVFINSNGNEVRLDSNSVDHQINDRVVDVPCSDELVSATYNSIAAEIKIIKFENDSIQLELQMDVYEHFTIENPVGIDTNHVESITFRKINKLTHTNYVSFGIITNLRNKTLTSGGQVKYEDQYQFYDSRTIVDSTFNNVYADKNNKLFYNIKSGLIGFYYNDVEYRLKKIN